MPQTSSSKVPGIIFATLMVLIFYAPVFLGGKAAVNTSDGLYLANTRTHYMAEAVKSGDLHFWNPYVNLGQAFSDGASSPFSPMTFLFLFLNPWTAHSLFILINLWGLIFCSWLYFRKMCAGTLAGFAGTFIYVLSGPVFFHHSYYSDIPALLGLPLTLYLLHLFDERKSKRYLIAAACTILYVVIASNPDMTLQYMGLIMIERMIFCYLNGKEVRTFLLWSGLLITAVLAGAISFIPLAEWVKLSSRTDMDYGNNFFPVLSNLFSAILSGTFVKEHFYEALYFYIGIPAILLALIGLRSPHARSVKLLGLVSLVFPLRYIVFYVMWSTGSTFMANIDHWRSMFPFMLIVGLFGSIGIKHLTGQWKMFSKNLAAKCLSSVILIVIFAHSIVLSRAHINKMCLAEAEQFKQQQYFWQRLDRSFDHSGGAGRVTGRDAWINSGLLYDVRIMPAYSNVYNKAYQQELEEEGPLFALPGKGYAQLWWMLESPDARDLAYYGVQYLLLWPDEPQLQGAQNLWRYREGLSLPKGPLIYENLYFRGRAYIVGKDNRMKNIPVTLKDTSHAQIDILVQNAQAGDRLILSDLAYPGWEVLVNGDKYPVEIFRRCLRAVSLQPGTNEVRWQFHSRSNLTGIIVTALALTGFCAIVWSLLKRN